MPSVLDGLEWTSVAIITMADEDDVEGGDNAGSRSPKSPKPPKSPKSPKPALMKSGTLSSLAGLSDLSPLNVLRSESVNYLVKDFHPSSFGWFTGSDNYRVCKERKAPYFYRNGLMLKVFTAILC